MSNLFKKIVYSRSSQFFELNILHVLNDGYYASLLLFLPFIAKDLSLNLTQAGFLGTLVNFLSIIFGLPAGYIATKFGGLKTLIFALCLYGIGYLGTGYSPNYILLFPMFILAGVGFALFHPIGFSLVAKLSSKENRGKLMGNFTAVGEIGRAGSSAILTFVIVIIGWRYTSLLYGIFAITLAILFYLFLIPKKEHFQQKENIISPIRLREIIVNKKFILALTTNFLDCFASSSLFIFLPFLLLQKGVSPALLGTFSAAFFAGSFLGKAILGRFVDRLGNVRVLIAAEILMALFIVILAHSTVPIIIILSSIILGIFTKGTAPVNQTMISEAVEHHGNFEKAFGISQTVVSIALTITPVFLGFLSDRFGIIMAFNTMAVFALLAIIPAFLFKITNVSG